MGFNGVATEDVCASSYVARHARWYASYSNLAMLHVADDAASPNPQLARHLLVSFLVWFNLVFIHSFRVVSYGPQLGLPETGYLLPPMSLPAGLRVNRQGRPNLTPTPKIRPHLWRREK